jgi:anti-sigma regulatory factor (Ser/Thr protein kinase)
MPYYRCAACGLTSYSAPAHSTARVCPNCSATFGDAARVYLTPRATHTIDRTLPTRLDAASKARRVVVGLPIARPAREQLALAVSELVTNAVRHAGAGDGAPLRVRVRLRSGRVRVEVTDEGPGFDPTSPSAVDPTTVGGRGLHIVAAVSESWGVIRGRDGCTVWCEIPVEEPARVAEHEVTGAYVRELAAAMPAVPVPGSA